MKHKLSKLYVTATEKGRVIIDIIEPQFCG